MSGTLTAGKQVRSDVFFGVGALSGVGDFNYSTMQLSNGATNPVSAQADTYLTIDTLPGETPASDLFVGTGFGAIEDVNDLSPVILAGADSVAGELVYQGDSGDQTVYAGVGTEYAALVGFGNTFVTPTVSGGTYEVAAGLAGPNQLQALASATGQEGNNIAIGSGDASIAAGLGFNHIFLGSGTALVANEGFDTIAVGSGAATVNGAGAATIFAGTGSIEYDGAGGTALIVASTVAGAGKTDVTGGAGSVTVYGGTGDVAVFGGQAGNNVLVSGSGNSALVGGGNNDLLVANGAGTTSLSASDGNATLFAANATGSVDFTLGAGNDTVVAGTGNEHFELGTGNSTIFGGTGHDVYSTFQGGGSNLVVGFDTASDYLDLSGSAFYGSAASFLANDVSIVNGSTYVNVPIDTGTDKIELYGVTNLSASNLILPPYNQI